MVREPRVVLAEMGLLLPAETAVCVLDSTADCRYMVLPRPPRELSNVQDLPLETLRGLVTRDSLLGLALL
jgi:nitrile hydratase